MFGTLKKLFGTTVSSQPTAPSATESSEQLIPVFVPSLSAVLLNHEKQKGTPLTEEEVLAIRNKSVVIMLAQCRAALMEESRGYPDIDPEHCWEQWQHLRTQFSEPGNA